MVYDVQATYDGLEYSKVNKDIDVDAYDWMDCFESWFNDRRFDLMQYTGIKDKSGVGIYEGDIYHHGDPRITYTVVWVDSGLMGKQNNSTSYAGLESWRDQIEVIGNIYENKSLLEDHS
ncbi:YopX family protein [Jeotgalibaca sp. MA1X17-3]|nr:YopX family protein [Jeotgalibaca sp. MA1X17-3]